MHRARPRVAREAALRLARHTGQATTVDEPEERPAATVGRTLGELAA